MVRAAERPGAGQGAAGDQAGHRMDHGGFQQLARRQRRQDAGQARGHHRLARPGRADEEQVVAAGRGDLQSPFGALLAFHIAQVFRGFALNDGSGRGRALHLGSTEMVDHADQRARGHDPAIGGPGRFRPASLGADEA